MKIFILGHRGMLGHVVADPPEARHFYSPKPQLGRALLSQTFVAAPRSRSDDPTIAGRFNAPNECTTRSSREATSELGVPPRDLWKVFKTKTIRSRGGAACARQKREPPSPLSPSDGERAGVRG